jgi:2-hydroxy-6-oxonona-2,4-dienedioate hydrolase
LDYQYMQVGKLRARYLDAGSGKPVLFMHGLGGSIESWTNNIGELAKIMRVIAVDLPGFGLSDKPKMNYTIRFYRDFVVQFLKQLLRLEQVSIVGSSLGGHIAAEVVINHPSLVKKLVLISPAGALPRSFKGSPALWRYVRVVNAKSVQQVKQALFAVDNKPVADSYAQVMYEKFLMPGAKEAFLSALAGSARAPRLNSRLNRIKAPMLLLWGKEDYMIPVKFVEPFVRMKNCRIILIENCGHRPHFEQPALFNKIVSDFLLS